MSMRPFSTGPHRPGFQATSHIAPERSLRRRKFFDAKPIADRETVHGDPVSTGWGRGVGNGLLDYGQTGPRGHFLLAGSPSRHRPFTTCTDVSVDGLRAGRG